MVKFVVVFAAIIASAFGFLAEPKIDSSLDWRVVGGANAAAGQFPHQISLRNGGSHSCGGSIINSRWILTAAHCVVGASASRLTVVVGSTTLNSGGVTYSVSKILYHENYNSGTIQNDVAVVQVSSDIAFNDNTQPIQHETSNVGEVSCTISGWGTTSYPGSVPNNLQYLDLLTISVSDCQSRWGSNPVYDSQVCTLTQSGEGVCHGDSGGPLISNGKQIGIVSWGNPCANGYPDVFTRVSSFNSWIETAISS